jgi:hypothetical protein
VVEQNAVAGMQVIGLVIGPGQFEAANLADAIAGAGMKPRVLVLWNLFHLAEHPAGSCKVKTAARYELGDRGKHEMRAVNICVEG